MPAKCFLIIIALAISVVSGNRAFGQYLGVTCGYQYSSSQLNGPPNFPGQTNQPMFNPPSDSPHDPNNVVWGVWVEQLALAGVDFVCPNLTGMGSSTNIAPMVAYVNSHGLTDKLKFGCFDDNAASWCASYNQSIGKGFGYATPMDLSDTNNWKFIYDYNYKYFFQTVADSNRFKLNGRPPIIIWSSGGLFITNAQGNLSRAMTYVRQSCQRDFGINPFIIGDANFHVVDTTCTNGIIDGEQAWFTAGPAGPSDTLTTYNDARVGVAVAEFQHPGQGGYLDPNHGQLFQTGLAGTAGQHATLTLCEGFTDVEEDAAMWRTRNMDASGNLLSYTNTLYDWPNQRIETLRQFSQNPFPTTLQLAAVGCDYYGGAAGGNGQVNFYRNGNIAIQTSTDTGGGFNVGWMQPGEWLEWTNLPLTGSPHFQLRIATPNSGQTAHLVIDGVAEPSQTLPNTGGYQNWATYDFGTYGNYGNSYHDIRIVFDTGGVNFNWWQFTGPANPVPATPTGLIATAASPAQINLSWGAASGATSYNVKRATTSGGPYVTVWSRVAGTTLTNIPVSVSTAYYYVVSAVNSGIESGDSTEAAVSTTSEIPITGSWTATASVQSSSASSAIDHNVTTRWSTVGSQAPGQWFRVDMKTTNTFYKVALNQAQWPGDYPRGYQVYVSNDGVNWGSPVATGVGASSITTIVFAPQTARYIQVTQTGSTSGTYWGIAEFNVYGEGPTATAFIQSLNLGSSHLTFSGVGGAAGGSYHILSATNLIGTVVWTPVTNNYFDGTGAFSNNIPINVLEPNRYYRLVQP